jgi:outer membrane protein assembly factor BamB
MKTMLNLPVFLVILISLPNPAVADPAESVFEAAGIRGGLVVELPFVDPQFTAQLGGADGVVVQSLHGDAHQVFAARTAIQAAGRDGRITVEQCDGQTLPYADNLVSLLVVHDPLSVSQEEMVRVLRPGGVAVFTDGAGQPTGDKIVKPWPADLAPWTHFLSTAAGNAVAADRQVAPATALQWVAEPLYCRSHEIDSSLPAMVSAQGRLFYILDEGPIGITDPRFPARWSLLARDAFNGVLLWKRPLAPWGWQEWKPEIREADWRLLRGQRGRFPSEVPRRLVAVGDRVYVTLGFHDAPISILDAASGELLAQCPQTAGTQELIVDEGTIFARIRPAQADTAQRRGEKPTTNLVALDAASGQPRWSRAVRNINPLTLTAARGVVVFQRGASLLCYDQHSGQPRWEAACPPSNIVVIHEDVVLLTDKTGTHAFQLSDGKPLWTGPATGRDLFVIDDLVWRIQETTGILQQREEIWPTLSRRAGAQLLGYSFRTGELQRTIDIPNAMSPGHHLRCYRSKATERFIIYPKRGAEFLDLHGDDHMRHDWLRGSCQYGILPCNGLLYTPPDQCFCYVGAKLNGLVATSGARTGATSEPPTAPRLIRGPAYGQTLATPAGAADWPGFRADAKRSGANRQAVVAENLERKWEVELRGRLTQPTIAAGTVFVANVDQHVVHAFDAASGESRWMFTAGGRVDSSPTYHEGLLLFGANDGNVYCLDAASGELAWRFQAAPNPRRIMAFGQVESPWPVHGTVLIWNALAYVAAGRSTLIDGGAHFYALRPRTGEVVHHAAVRQPPPDLSREIGEHFAMDGSNIDVLTTDGTHIFCLQEMFDAALNRIATPWNTRYGDRFLGDDHLMATGGILDDSGFNRLFWTYGNRWPGFYFMMLAPRSGNLLVFDETHTWATKWFVERNIHSPLFFPQTTGYLLFCDHNTTRPFLVGDPQAPQPIRWLPDTLMEPYEYDGRRISNRHDDFSVEVDKGAGFTRGTAAVWQRYVPVRIEALALTRDALLAAGTPDVLDPADPLGALEGRHGGVLLVLDPATGQRRSEKKLASPPRFDGLSAAGQQLFLVTRDGRLSSWE